LASSIALRIHKPRPLAPDIQEELLFLPLIERGKDLLLERHLRPIAAVPDWRKQRRMWKESRSA
jgi:hypothetical protein